jgi:hypothetical protein
MTKIKIVAIVVLLLVIGTALMHTLGVDSEWVRLGDWGAIASIAGILIYLLTPSKPVVHSSPSKTDMSIRQGGKKNRAIFEKALGPDHPDVATSLENLAALYRATQRDKESVELENNAERIRAIKR